MARNICMGCGKKKPLSEFSKRSNRPLGRASRCKACQKAYSAAYYERNRQAIRDRNAAWDAENADRLRAYKAGWRKANPEMCSDSVNRYRARKANAAVSERVDRVAVIARDDSICHLCHKPCEPHEIHIDHLVPLSRDGDHCSRNVAVAHARCNQRRNNRPLPATSRYYGQEPACV